MTIFIRPLSCVVVVRPLPFFLMGLAVTVCLNASGAVLAVPGEYASIREAIDAATPGDIVEVGPGIYEETLLFKEGIELRGAGPDSTIVRAASIKGELLRVKNAASGSIAGFKFEHADAAHLDPNRKHWPDAVDINNSSVEIRNCIMGPSAGCGIIIHEKSNSRVVECRFQDNSQAGIYVRGEGTTATLLHNTCINNHWGGICLTKGANAVAEENTCFNNGRWGIKVLGKGTSIVLKNNTFTGNRGSGIMLEQWATGVAEGNTCRENDGNGIMFTLGSNGTVAGNTCEKNAWHGVIVQSLGVTIAVRDNRCNDNGYNGVTIGWGAGSEVAGNTCNQNTRCGIMVVNWFTNSTVRDNECNENTLHGIAFSRGAKGTAAGNVCRKNTSHGILVRDETTEADIGQNSCEENGGENVAREEGDPVSRQNQVEEEEIGCALVGEHFDAIETMADLLRQHGCRYSGGGWQLHTFYEGLQKGCGDITPRQRDEFTALMERWKKAHPDSVTPLITQAQVHAAYGWDARGGGYADTVTDSGWKVFRQELGVARDYLLEAEALNGKDPHLYKALIDVCNCLDNSTRELQAMFDKGVAIDVGYFPLYFSRAWTLTYRWGGRPGEMERFADKAYDLSREEYGSTLYALIAVGIASHLGEDDFLDEHSFDWARIDNGFDELTRQFPESNFYLNQHCLMACIYGDREKAKTLFEKIGGKTDDSAWRGTAGFRKWKQWCLAMGRTPLQEPSAVGAVTGLLFKDGTLTFDGILWIGGAVVFALLFVAIVLFLYSARTKRRQPPMLPASPGADERKGDDGTTM